MPPIGRCNGTIFSILLFLLLRISSSLAANTTCPVDQPIAANYLDAIMATQTNVFYPSAYFFGGAVKMVSANNMTNFYHRMICADGATVASRIYLYDDGTHGDDVAGDGLYTRSCVHFCQSVVDYSDIWNFAYQQTIQSADLVVVKPDLQGQIPYHVIQSPKYPKATIYATSHAVFFVDSQRYYMPTWPIDFVWDYAGARNVAVSAVLDIFGDVFDWFSMTPFDFNLRYCTKCKAIPGYYNIKYHGWERTGGATAFRRPGELSDCDFAMTGFPITRMVGGVSNEDMITEFLGQIHEWLHGAAGFSYQKYAPKARAGDGMHVPGTCTSDHSQLQGPLWDWVQGYPTPVPLSYCVGIKDCYEKAYDLVRLEPNTDCGVCPDANLSSCCSFRYEDAINTREFMLKKPNLFQASPLLQYVAGVLPYAEFPTDQKNYYCMGADTDKGCGLNKAGGNCTIPVNDTDRSYVTSTFVTRYTLEDLIQGVGGFRDPPSRRERDFRSAPIHLGQRVPSEAEMVFRTLFWRYQEQESQPWTRTTNAFNNRRVPLVTWQYTTNGRSTIHSKLHGIPCGGGLQVKSCIDDQTVCDDFACGMNATCYPYDGRPLCVCDDGFWGDGNLCLDPAVPAAYPKIFPYLWSAHELFINGTNAQYYPKYTVKQYCFPETVDWPAVTSESQIAPYPGGIPQYGLKSCGMSSLCTLSESCVQNACIPFGQPGTLTPTLPPSFRPTKAPTTMPSSTPIRAPTFAPTLAPTRAPTSAPTNAPTSAPTLTPNGLPTKVPTRVPSLVPTTLPRLNSIPPPIPTSPPPSRAPTVAPTKAPTTAPFRMPTEAPTISPTIAPTKAPTKIPTLPPTKQPTELPTKSPTNAPTKAPTKDPTLRPSKQPTKQPTALPTRPPTSMPSMGPSMHPSVAPSSSPTQEPSNFVPNFRRTAKAARVSKRKCGCKPRGTTKAAINQFSRCTKRVINKFFNKDLATSRVRNEDRGSWIQAFYLVHAEKCSKRRKASG